MIAISLCTASITLYLSQRRPSLLIDVAVRRPRPRQPHSFHCNHIGPAVSRKVRRIFHVGFAGKLVGSAHTVSQPDLPRLAIVGAVIDVWAGNDIENTVVIEVRRAEKSYE